MVINPVKNRKKKNMEQKRKQLRMYYAMCKWQTYIYSNKTLLYFQPPRIKFGAHDLKKNLVPCQIYFLPKL